MASFEEWMSAVRQEGLHERVDIVASVQPLAGSDQAESIAACAETAAALKSADGVRGVHIMGGGMPDVAAAVIAGAGLAPA